MIPRPLLTWFIEKCEAELKARDDSKPPNGWVGVSHETMLFDIVYHMGKLTRAAYDKDWPEYIRQCANCANEFAMMADNAQGQLNVEQDIAKFNEIQQLPISPPVIKPGDSLSRSSHYGDKLADSIRRSRYKMEEPLPLQPSVKTFIVNDRTIEARMVHDTDDEGWDLYEGDDHLNPGAIIWCDADRGIIEDDVRHFLERNIHRDGSPGYDHTAGYHD